MNENSKSADLLVGSMAAGAGIHEVGEVIGCYHAVCRDVDGNLLWEEEFDNLVTTVGKNFLLDTTLAGSAYTVVGPFMGLISSTSFSNPVAADTMASHAGWLEAGTTNAPTYANRLTLTWSAASAGVKATSSTNTFTFTGAGTVSGAFIVTGTGAVNTNLSTAGSLYSAGQLTTPQPVIATNTLTLTYSTTLT